MYELAPIIKDLAIMLGIAGIVALMFQKIRQPVILGYIIAGVIIGPHTPPYSLVTDAAQINTLSELGVIFLMFALGLDFSFHKLKRIGFSAIITGLIKVTIVTIVGFYIGWFMRWDFYNCLFLGAALAISSTTIIIKSLDELGLKGKKFTDLVFGILIAEDLLAVLMLTTLSTVVITKNLFSLDMVLASLKVILVISSWFLSGYFLVPILFRKIVKYVSQEALTVVSIALCLSLAVIASYFHYSTALGAFIMGSILAETPLAYRIKQLTCPLKDVFAAVFFISVGMTIDLKILAEHWSIIVLISILTIIGKILATSLGAFLSGQSLNTSLRAGFSMPPVGEFSFIIVSLGLLLGVTSSSLSQVIVGVAAVTTLVTPYLIKLSGKIAKKLDTNLSERSKYFLESYSAWIYRALASYKKQTNYRKYVVRLIINGVIIATIFKLAHAFILPQLNYLIINIHFSKLLSWIITLVGVAPFAWGMLFSFKLIPKNRQIPPLFLGWVLSTTEIIIFSIAYFGNWYIPLGIIIIVGISFGLAHKQLEISYRWFEKHLVLMLRKRHKKQTKYEELAPWDTHLVEIIASNQSPSSVTGKTLNDSQLRQKFGINIVAIRRGTKIILAPRGEEQILPHDKLIVLGNDDQIDAFKKNLEEQQTNEGMGDILENFALKAVVLDKNSPYVGRTIRSSKIREQNSGLVVGLERNGFRILNPDPATLLKTNDLLLIVGMFEVNPAGGKN